MELSLASDGAPVLADLEERKFFGLLSNGAVDESFGVDGGLQLSLATASEGVISRSFTPTGFTVDSSGRLLVFGFQSDSARSVPVFGTPGGLASRTPLVLRLDPSGALDPTFGGGRGFVRSTFGLTSPLSPKVPLVQAMGGTVDSRDRPVLLAGAAAVAPACIGKGGIEEVPRAVVRLTTSGALDPTFGRGGKSTIEGTQSGSLLGAGEGQLAVGTGPIGGNRPQCRYGATVYRLGPNGERSAEFGPAGVRSFRPFRLGALEPSGGVIVDYLRRHTLVLKRIAPSGTTDTSFGSDGVADVSLPTRPGLQVSSVLVDEQSRVLICGFVEGNPAKHRRAAFIVARVLADGRLDREFGADGWVTTALPRLLKLTSAQAKLDGQGRLVVAGTVVKQSGPGASFLVARYLLGPA